MLQYRNVLFNHKLSDVYRGLPFYRDSFTPQALIGGAMIRYLGLFLVLFSVSFDLIAASYILIMHLAGVVGKL